MRSARQQEIVLSGAVTVAAAAAALGVSPKWIFRRIKAGRLHVVGREGRCILVASSPTTYLAPTALAPPSSSYTGTRPGELCTIVHGADSAVVTVAGARATRVLDTVAPAGVRRGEASSGWLIPSRLVPLLHAAM